VFQGFLNRHVFDASVYAAVSYINKWYETVKSYQLFLILANEMLEY
jgi:hypothetical protein